jgi:HSP20 family protein
MQIVKRRDPEAGLVTWSPFQEMEQLSRRMDTLFNRFFDLTPARFNTEQIGFEPALDVYETPEEFVAFITAPGLAQGDINVEVTDNRLTVTGERKPLIEGEHVTPLFLSRAGGYGKFTLNYDFPVALDHKKVKAVYNQGILQIRLPKAEAAKPKSIQVEVK